MGETSLLYLGPNASALCWRQHVIIFGLARRPHGLQSQITEEFRSGSAGDDVNATLHDNLEARGVKGVQL